MLSLSGVLATLTALGHELTIAALSEGPTGEFGLDPLDFLGSGYWIALLGVAAAAVVVGVELARARP